MMNKKASLNYSEHYEIIVALVTYLAVCNRKTEDKKKIIDNATAWWLAQHLGLKDQEDEVRTVLAGHKNLFRESLNDYGKKGHRYSLLLRYSHRPYDSEGAQDVSDPLSNEELFSLLNFISNQVSIEQAENRQKENNRNERVAMFIAVLSAVIAASASVIATLIK
jgi:hypothetical protein